MENPSAFDTLTAFIGSGAILLFGWVTKRMSTVEDRAEVRVEGVRATIVKVEGDLRADHDLLQVQLNQISGHILDLAKTTVQRDEFRARIEDILSAIKEQKT